MNRNEALEAAWVAAEAFAVGRPDAKQRWKEAEAAGASEGLLQALTRLSIRRNARLALAGGDR